MLIIILIILSIVSSVFTSFLEVYKFNLLLVPENFIMNKVKDIQTYTDFFTKTYPSNILGWGLIGLFIIFFIFGTARLKINSKYTQMEGYGSHGTARFQTPREIKNNYFKDKLGWFLGSNAPELKYSVGMSGAYHCLLHNQIGQYCKRNSPVLQSKIPHFCKEGHCRHQL